MSKITVTNEKMSALHDAFDMVSKCTPTAPTDSKSVDECKRFKYAAGRNYRRARQALQKMEASMNKIESSFKDAEFEKFQNELTALNETFCQKDDEGVMELKTNEQTGEQSYIIPKAIKKEYDKQVKKLQRQFKDALKAKADNDKKVQACWKDKQTIELHTVPWDTMPATIAGGYMDVITPMLTGVPK